jgi:DNA helicase-2/ATP-dependent DNA helicase PcrA
MRVGTFHGIFLKILKQDIESLDPIYPPQKKPKPATPEKEKTSTQHSIFTPDSTNEPNDNSKWTKGFTIYDPSECLSLIRAIIKELKLEDHIKPKEAKGMISKYKEKTLFPLDVLKSAMSELDERMGEIYDRYTKALIKANAVDFDDLLFLSYHLFKQSPKVLAKRQNKRDYIMVDEAQDTNQVQFDLMRMLSKKCNNVTLIGDDYQSIYGRRGAVMENFLNVKKYRADIVIHKLQINYRSRPHIVAA